MNRKEVKTKTPKMKNTYRDTIQTILTKHPETRNSDTILYGKLLSVINHPHRNKSLIECMENWTEYKLPSTETVRRTRQELQSEHKELQADKKVREARRNKEKIIVEYYREKKINS